MTERLTNLGAIRRYLSASNSAVRFTGRGLYFLMPVRDAAVPCELLWEPERGVIQLLLGLPLAWPNEYPDAADPAVVSLNSDLPVGAFQLRSGGRKFLLFTSHIFLSHDGTVSALAIDASLREARAAIERGAERLGAALLASAR